jgi:hypothetical protein
LALRRRSDSEQLTACLEEHAKPSFHGADEPHRGFKQFARYRRCDRIVPAPTMCVLINLFFAQWVQRFGVHPRAAHDRTGCRRLQTVLDGVFERHKDFFDVWRQMAAALDVGPECDWRRKDRVAVQTNGFEIVVQIGPLAAVKRIARLSHAGPAIPPVTHSADVCAALIGEKHVSPPIEALGVPLQTARGRCQRSQVCIVGHDHEHIDVLRIRLGRHHGAQECDSSHASQLSDGHDESA